MIKTEPFEILFLSHKVKVDIISTSVDDDQWRLSTNQTYLITTFVRLQIYVLIAHARALSSALYMLTETIAVWENEQKGSLMLKCDISNVFVLSTNSWRRILYRWKNNNTLSVTIKKINCNLSSPESPRYPKQRFALYYPVETTVILFSFVSCRAPFNWIFRQCWISPLPELQNSRLSDWLSNVTHPLRQSIRGKGVFRRSASAQAAKSCFQSYDWFIIFLSAGIAFGQNFAMVLFGFFFFHLLWMHTAKRDATALDVFNLKAKEVVVPFSCIHHSYRKVNNLKILFY